MKLPTQRSVQRQMTVICVTVACMFACSPPMPGSHDFRTAFPIKVQDKTFTIKARFVQSDDEANLEDTKQLQEFVREFHRRATSRMLLTTARDLDKSISDTLITVTKKHLHILGMRANDLVIRPSLTSSIKGAPEVILSFRGALAEVPVCGDWSGETGFNPTNMPSKNYGCAYQRNIGLMVSDPDDLRHVSGHGTIDSQRLEQVIKNYREGTATGAEWTGGSGSSTTSTQ
ncbi:MAG: CpaD family pilus assembly lipoprotein [Alphaproteobacteria bacterium]